MKKNTIRKIASECGCSTSTVMKWIKYYKQNQNENEKRGILDNEAIMKQINNINLNRKTRKSKSSIIRNVANFISKKQKNRR